jgi:hypothetical protein
MTDQTSPATGTFECPICGYPSPHYHSPSEKIRWHQQYRPIFEASIQKRIRRSDPSFYLFSVDAVQITGIARRLGTPGIYARQPGDWAELRHDGGYVCGQLQTLWEIFQDGVCAGLVQQARQAVEREPAHAEPEDEWMVNLAIVAHSGEPTVEAAAKLIMDWYQGAEPDRAEAVESEREKVLEEVAQALLDAGYGEAYEVIYKLQSQQPAQADGKEKP